MTKFYSNVGRVYYAISIPLDRIHLEQKHHHPATSSTSNFKGSRKIKDRGTEKKT